MSRVSEMSKLVIAPRPIPRIGIARFRALQIPDELRLPRGIGNGLAHSREAANELKACFGAFHETVKEARGRRFGRGRRPRQRHRTDRLETWEIPLIST